jgi:hypothetical protein
MIEALREPESIFAWLLTNIASRIEELPANSADDPDMIR